MSFFFRSHHPRAKRASLAAIGAVIFSFIATAVPAEAQVGTWVAHELVQNWRGVASSSDGTKLVATIDGGQLYTSTDSGVSWIARESARNWTSVASSSDGSKLVATVWGGQIYCLCY